MTGRHFVPARRDRLPAAVVPMRTFEEDDDDAPVRGHRTRGAGDEGGGEPVRGRAVARRRWGRAVRERLWPVLGFTALVTALVGWYAFRAPPVYRAEATVLMEAGEGFRTGVELLRSRSLARSVVDSEDLWRDPTLATDAPDPATGVFMVDRERVVDELLSRLHLERVGSTGLVEVGIDSPDPARAAAIVNALAVAATGFALEGGAEPVTVRLVDRAAVPRSPAGVPPWLLTALAALGSLLLAALAAIARDRVNDTLRDEEDVERGFGLPLLGALPAIQGRARRRRRGRVRGRRPDRGRDLPPGDPVETAERHGAFGEAMDRARTVVCLREGGRRDRVLLVTSSAAQEGRSTVALGLAYALSGAEKVLLIDADVDRPAIGTAAGIEFDAPGLTDVLVGAVRAGRAIRRDAFYRSFDVLPCGPVPERPTELLTSPRFTTLLTLLEDHYDRIVIDCGPVRADADALAFGRLADAIVFVARARHTRIATARRALRRLVRARVPLAGVLITRVPERDAGGWSGCAGEGLDHDIERRHPDAARLVLTRRERRALQRDDDDFELGMSVARPSAKRRSAGSSRSTSTARSGASPRSSSKPTSVRSTPKAITSSDAGPDLTDPTEDLSQELPRDASVPYDPFAYDPDVDDVYADRDVNALVARLMADATQRRPVREHGPPKARDDGAKRRAGREPDPDDTIGPR